MKLTANPRNLFKLTIHNFKPLTPLLLQPSTTNPHHEAGYYTNPSGFKIAAKMPKIDKIMNGPWCMRPFSKVERPYLRG